MPRSIAQCCFAQASRPTSSTAWTDGCSIRAGRFGRQRHRPTARWTPASARQADAVAAREGLLRRGSADFVHQRRNSRSVEPDTLMVRMHVRVRVCTHSVCGCVVVGTHCS